LATLGDPFPGPINLLITKSNELQLVFLLQVEYRPEKLPPCRFLGHVVPTRYVSLSSRDKHLLNLVLVGDQHVCVAVSSSTSSRSWICVTDLASCTVVFGAEMSGHVTVGGLSSPDARHVYVCAGESLHVYQLKPDIRFVGETRLSREARAIIFTKVRYNLSQINVAIKPVSHINQY